MNIPKSLAKKILEYKKSSTKFITECCKIKHPAAGVIPFNLFGYQRNALRDFSKHRFNIIRKNRQSGISTLAGAHVLHRSMFSPNHLSSLIVSKKDDDAKLFLERNVKFMFDNLPNWMKEVWDPIKCNEHEIVLRNGSSIKSLTSSPSVLRSHSASNVIIDEAAFINRMDEVWAGGWSCLVSESLISTENGLVPIGSLVKNEDEWQDIDINVDTDNGYHRADKLYLSGICPVNKISTKCGGEIIATKNHRLRVIDPNGQYVWKYVGNITPGDYLVTKVGEKPEKQDINGEFYILGIMLCGGESQEDSISVKFNSQLITTEFYECCESVFGEDNFLINKRQLKVKKELAEKFLNKYRIDYFADKDKRFIPSSVYNLGRDGYYHVLCGIIDAHSSGGKRIGMVFDSYSIARDIKTILMDFGFPSIISETESGQWRIVICDSEIGSEYSECFYSTRNEIRVCAESGHSFSTDHEILHHFYKREQEIIAEELKENSSKCSSKIRFNDVQSSLEKSGDMCSWLVSRNLFLTKVESVVPGIRETFDIQVPGPHCYIANNLVNHNTLQHGGNVIVISTLNGMGDWYYRTVKGAEAGNNGFNLIDINWYDMDWVIEYKDPISGEEFRIAPCDGIKECLTAKEQEIYGKYWSPWLEKQYQALVQEGEAWKFDQEILARVVSSGKTVLPSKSLESVGESTKDPEIKVEGIKKYKHPINGRDITLNFDFGGSDGFWIWDKPVKSSESDPQGYKYIVGVDTATGRGEDSNSIQVICANTLEQVAEMNMKCIPKMLAAYIDMIGRYYNNAIVSVERNNGGDGVIDELRLEYNYPNLWRNIKVSEKPGAKSILEPYGHYTTESSKIRLNKSLINTIGIDGGIKVFSKRLYSQLCTYINHRDKSGRATGKTGAENTAGCHDDLVMALSIAIYAFLSDTSVETTGMTPFNINFDDAVYNPESDRLGEYDQNLIYPVSDFDETTEDAIERSISSFSADIISNVLPTEIPAVKKRKYS